MSVATEIQRLQAAKADIKTAIEAKGVTVPSTTKLDGYASLIEQIGPEPLPYDAEVEYLESDGYQTVNTNFIPTGDDIEYTIKFNYLGYLNVTTASYAQIFYAFTDASKKSYRILIQKSNNTSSISNANYVANSSVNEISKFLDNTVYVVNSHLTGGFVNNIPYNSRIDSNATGENTEKLVIIRPDTKVRIYYLRFIKGGSVVLDLIPVRVGQVGYFYDKVSKQLLGNSGTGAFTLGSDVISDSEALSLITQGV